MAENTSFCYKISQCAYAKMVFHAAKYPHLAVNGVLLGSKTEGEIVDAIPLFHQCLNTVPMQEIALMQIDTYADYKNLVVAGYYCAAENFADNTLDKAPAHEMGDKIQENYDRACFVLIDNKLMTLGQEVPPFTVYEKFTQPGRWREANFKVLESEATLQAVSALLKRGAMKDIVDFDLHLDDAKSDWTNQFMNRDLKQIMAMY